MVVIEIEKNDLLKLVGKEITDEEIENTLFGLKCEATIEDNKITCELNPDRLDMISVEGIARAIKAYLGLPIKKYEPGESNIVVKGESLVRPAFSAAVVEGVTMTDDFVASLMQIQENLHITI